MTETNLDKTKTSSYKKIKSKLIIKKIFSLLPEYNLLKIIRHNKEIQDKLNKDIDDYKKALISEILIIPKDKVYGQIINKIPRNSLQYFHFYLNDAKNELNRTYFTKEDNAKKIRIIIDYDFTNFSGLFQNRYYIKEVNFIKLYRYNITNISNMFYKCLSLEKINLSRFNTCNVTDMSNMFGECKSLKIVEFGKFKFRTNNVKNMSNMFYNCKKLENLDLSNFVFNNLINMNDMFYGCLSLKDLNLSSLIIIIISVIKELYSQVLDNYLNWIYLYLKLGA